MKNLILSELSLPELKKYESQIDLAVIPVGSHEQHGPNMVFATDSVLAYELSKKIGEIFFPRILICPSITLGNSYHHMDFFGSMTLRPETFIHLIIDMAESLKKHKIKKILLLNGHGGNRHPLGVAVTKIKFELGFLKVGWIGPDLGEDLLEKKQFSSKFSSVRGHACEGEVSMALYLAPWLVKKDCLCPGELKKSLWGKSSWYRQVPWSFHDITENGALGNATLASYELGKKITEHVLQKYQKFINEYFFDSK